MIRTVQCTVFLLLAVSLAAQEPKRESLQLTLPKIFTL